MNDHRWFAFLACVAGLAASRLLVEVPPGINVPVVGALTAAAVLSVARNKLEPIDRVYALAAFLFLAMFALRTSSWLLAADMAAALALGSLAASGGRTWSAVIRGGTAAVTRLHRGFAAVIVALPRPSGWPGGAERAGVIRGTAAGIFLAIVFGSLFASGDAAFARVVGDLVVPQWDLGALPARVVAAVATIALTGALAVVATERGVERNSLWKLSRESAAKRKTDAVEWGIAIGLVDIVFGVFVWVQLAVLFGGRDHVLRTTGLSYAQYARSGFFQLVFVAALVLLLIALTVRFGAPSSVRERHLMQGLVGLLCVLTLVVLASALTRLGLYEETYGFTRLRFFVHLTILWMAAVFAAVMLAGARWSAGWLPRIVVALCALFLLGANAIGPDGFIARRNVERYERTGRIDVAYLASLDADAVPPLTRLPERVRACALGPHARRLQEPESSWSFNLGRQRARATLGSLPEVTSGQGACPS